MATLNFADNMWDQFEKVVKRLNEGKNFSSEVASFVQKRALLEKEYAMKLQKLTKMTTIEESASLGSAWTSLRTETEKLALWHDQFGDRLVSEVKDHILEHRSESKRQARVLVEQGTKIIKDLEIQTDKRDKARSAYYRARRKQDETQEEYDRATMSGQPAGILQKLGKKATKDEKVAIKADTAYKAAIATLVEAQVRMYDTEMPKTMSELQRIEITRLQVTQSSLKHIVSLQSGLADQVTERCGVVQPILDAVDASADIVAFVERATSGKPKPPKADYEPYDPKDNRRLSLAAPLTLTPSSTTRGHSGSISLLSPRASAGGAQGQARAATIVATSASTATSPSKTSVAAAPASPVPTPRGPVLKVRALFDYTGETQPELSFKKGDIITVTEKDESGWWQGELNGVIGAFPSGWVEDLSAPGQSTSPAKGSPPQIVEPPPEPEKQARALYAFRKEQEEEIDVNVGDLLVVDVDDGSGWIYGFNQTSGEGGRFPANYVEYL